MSAVDVRLQSGVLAKCGDLIAGKRYTLKYDPYNNLYRVVYNVPSMKKQPPIPNWMRKNAAKR